MSESDNNDVALIAKLDQSGLTASARSRFVSAVDRLLGGLVEIPATHIDNHVRRVQLRGEADLVSDAFKLKSEIQRIFGEDEPSIQAAENLVKKERRRFENKRRVVEAAVEDLSENSDLASDLDMGNLSPDWISKFERFSEDASSEEVQLLWGRILSGEVRKPGTFSSSTLRFISELDAETAKSFEEVAKLRLETGLLPREKSLAGDRLIQLLTLEEAGLLQEVNSFLGIDLKPIDDGFCYLPNGNFMLRVKLRAGRSARVNMMLLTRAGKEICHILPKDSGPGPLEFVAKHIEDECSEVALFYTLQETAPGQQAWQLFRVYKQEGE